VADLDDRLTTPVALAGDQLSRVKEAADRDLLAMAHAMQRYASLYVAHRVGELDAAPEPSLVGCDEHSAQVARAVVEQVLNAEVLHGDALGGAAGHPSP
jgi:hypothetical protein